MPYTKEFRAANPELIKRRQSAANKKFNKNHPERVSKAKADWYKENRDHAISVATKWKKKNPEINFNGHLRRRYGLTRERYDQMLLQQNNLCGICKGPPVGRVKNGIATRFDVDHCHTTGEVRGLLCHPCNVMLGQARDRVDVFQAAILWLNHG